MPQRILKGLTEICTLHTGYTARTGLEPAVERGSLAIQLRDIAIDGSIDAGALTRVALDALPTRYLVAVGDVLFRSRGDRNTATALDDRFTEPSVAVLPLIVLRPNLRLVVPEYLAWALNQPAAQRHFAAAARGTSIRMVPKSSLDDLQLDVPGLDTQRRIVAIAALAAHETKLLHQLAKTKTDLTNRLLAECARQMPPTATPIRIKT